MSDRVKKTLYSIAFLYALALYSSVKSEDSGDGFWENCALPILIIVFLGVFWLFGGFNL